MTTQIRELTPAQLQALITGLPTYCPNMTFMLASQLYTTAQVVQLLTTVQSAATSVSTTKAAWTASIVAERAVAAKDGTLARELREMVGLMFANSPTTLNALAIAPRKTPKPLSAEARVAAEAKARATRLARGTMSKKQKATITGNVTGVTVTPVTSPSAPASASAAATPTTPAVGAAPSSPLPATASGGSGATASASPGSASHA